MFKKIIFLAFFSLFSSTFFLSDANANTFKEVKVIYSSTDVYSQPDLSSKVVATLAEGTIVTELKSNVNGYSFISFRGNDGKMAYGYVSDLSLDDAAYEIKVVASSNGALVKEFASKNSNTLATLQNNMVVRYYGAVAGGWSHVQYGNIVGYVASSHIKNSTPIARYSTTNGLVVRNIASTSGLNLGSLDKGEKVSVHSTIAGWSYITSTSVDGYVVASYLNAKDPNAVTTTPKTSNSSNKGSSSTSYKNCTELKRDFPNGVSSSHWAYQSKMDRDKDGWACE